MTRDRCSNRMPPNRSLDRGGDAWAAKAFGAPDQEPSGLIPAALIVWRHRWRSERLPTAALDAQMAHSQAGRGHSTPIAPAAGGPV
jgi:hypothetical protein